MKISQLAFLAAFAAGSASAFTAAPSNRVAFGGVDTALAGRRRAGGAKSNNINNTKEESMGNCQGNQSNSKPGVFVSTTIEGAPSDWKKDLDESLDALNAYLDKHQEFRASLLQSLVNASQSAKNLDVNLFTVLKELGGWPTSIDDYNRFLREFATYAPRQQDYQGWVGSKKIDGYEQSHQEVYDRLCHFYFLINDIQNDKWFSEWLIRYARVWGKFCDSPDSISSENIYSFYELSPKFEVLDCMIPMNEEDIPKVLPKYTIYDGDGKPLIPNNPSGWKTWNQFFARQLNPGLRPIALPEDNTAICSPADCTYRMDYPISDTNLVVGSSDFRLKRTHSIGKISDLLSGLECRGEFAGGTFVHYFLGPYSYHRFHAPVAGKVVDCRNIPGKVYLNVRIKDGQFDAPDNSEDGGGYEFSQARGVIVLDTKGSPYGDIGLVAVIPVGMCQVSGVRMTAKKGSTLQKGDEFGYFMFGGSDIIMLFQKGRVQEINRNNNYNLYGEKVVKATTPWYRRLTPRYLWSTYAAARRN